MPQIGLSAELTAAQVWAAATRALTNPSGVWSDASRTLTAFAAQDLFVYPAKDDTYAVTSPVSSASADTYGSWLQAIADVGVGRVLLHLLIANNNSLLAGQVANIQVGVGSAGNEAAVETVNIPGNTNVSVIMVPVFCVLSDNARVSLRVKNTTAAALTWRVCLMTVA